MDVEIYLNDIDQKVEFEIFSLEMDRYNSVICYQQIMKKIRALFEKYNLTPEIFISSLTDERYLNVYNSILGGLFLRILTENNFENVVDFLQTILI